MTNSKYIFDLETDDLLDKVTTIWLLTMENIETGAIHEYSDYDDNLPPLEEGLSHLNTAALLSGHNIIGYDLQVLKKLKGWLPNPATKIIDTWLMSQVNQFRRGHKHGLEGWGDKLGFPKIKFDAFHCYSQEMRTYCRRDVNLNTKVYKILVEEARKIIAKNTLYKLGLDVEMEFAFIESEIRATGWLFDMPKAKELLSEIEDKIILIESKLEPMMGMVCSAKDGKEEFKTPKWKKDGCYHTTTVNWFGYDPESGREDRPIEGPYTRIEFVQAKIGSDKVLKDWLYSLGWVPDEWNVEKIGRKFVNKSPKLTESSLNLLGEPGKMVSDYGSLTNRRGILRGWIEAAEADGRLHGKMWTIGTPTFRCRHEIIANLPSGKSMYGPEMRALLICEPGMKIVGADSAGNQMRGLCHYIGNEEFTNEVINGDVHQKNADILSGVYPCPRDTAKPWLYAYLFGSGDGKSGLILTGKRDATVGKRSKELFESSIPGLKELKEKLLTFFERSVNSLGKENGFIRGIDGRIILTESAHKLLNYLLQTLEGITCKAAAVYLKRELIKRSIPHQFVIHYHDEMGVICPEGYAKEVAELSVEAFTEAPKWFGVMCMNGTAKIGENYFQVH